MPHWYQRVAQSLIAAWLLFSIGSVAADSNAEILSAAQVREDFVELYQTLQEAHVNLYSQRSKAEYDALYQQMFSEFIKPLPRDQVEIAFQRFVAFGRVAHARIDGLQQRFVAFRQQGGRALPIGIRIQDGKVWIADNYSGVATVQRGDRLLALNGMPIATVLQQVGAHVSADTEYLLHTMLELWFPALIWQEFGPLSQFQLTLQRAEQTPQVLTIDAKTRSEAQAADAKQAPVLSLDWDQREARIINGERAAIGYLRPGPFYNNEPGANDVWDNRAFVEFIDQRFKQFIDAKLPAVLIDLRDNPGGDNSFSDHMLNWFADKPYRFASDFRIRVSAATTASNARRIPPDESKHGSIAQQYAELYAQHQPGDVVSYEFPFNTPKAGPRYHGEVFVLINRRSYSNAVLVAAIAQDYGFATVLGEETADLATTYGAMEQFTLTHSGLVVGYPKAYIIRPSGNTTVRGVQPDWPIKTPIVEAADDPVLQIALAHIRARMNN
ncbi:S41 family peptidase [Permianibacter aggregans]|uniref:C-terminal processing protease CtpA/Prc n=1 Tax=Permianibacter aggregans TaxID=1510150 RepID=A0A4R6UL97_9GAMM|nr:S41 family peptidase [Permianibacter aggregans]QGX39813.1 hypothetical protein E2H98_09145 [Permianibacter aggregans]TDQ45905.1 C-terminal processing protease CtpA/Prc [Permianibacter aggregans]